MVASLLMGQIAGLGFGLYAPNHSSWILTIVSPRRRGFGVGLVTTAMFLGQFSAPLLIQPFIDRTNPAAVWRAVSAALLFLGVLYAVLSRLGGKSARIEAES
jgi:MFS family permease